MQELRSTTSIILYMCSFARIATTRYWMGRLGVNLDYPDGQWSWTRNIDCLELLGDLPDDSIDMILTDPPWGTTQLKLDIKGRPPPEVWDNCMRVLKPSGWLFSFGQLPLFMDISRAGFADAFSYVWVKSSPILNRRKHFRPAIQHEMIQVYHRPDSRDRYYDERALRTFGHKNYFKKKGKVVSTWTSELHMEREKHDYNVLDFGRDGSTILHYPNKSHMRLGERTKHPTQKPIDLCAYLVGGYCPVGGVVLDPYFGSGSTLAAARGMRRQWAGAEMDTEWFRLGLSVITETDPIQVATKKMQTTL